MRVFFFILALSILPLWNNCVLGGQIIDDIQRQYAESQKKNPYTATPEAFKHRAEMEFYLKGAKLFDLLIKQLEEK